MDDFRTLSTVIVLEAIFVYWVYATLQYTYLEDITFVVISAIIFLQAAIFPIVWNMIYSIRYMQLLETDSLVVLALLGSLTPSTLAISVVIFILWT